MKDYSKSPVWQFRCRILSYIDNMKRREVGQRSSILSHNPAVKYATVAGLSDALKSCDEREVDTADRRTVSGDCDNCCLVLHGGSWKECLRRHRSSRNEIT